MGDDRVMLGKDELDNLLSPGDMVHTYKQAGPVIFGCDVERSKLLEMAAANGAELAGEQAEAMKHGVVIWDGKVPIFCATA